MSLMPSDIKEQEKLMGGLMTMQEFIWVFFGACIGVCVGVFVANILGIGPGVVVGVALIFSGVPFAFVKIQKMTLLDYLITSRKYKKKKKYLTKY